MVNEQFKVKTFYDEFWPKNIPNYKETEKYVLSTIPKDKKFYLSFDAGCGTGVCSLALSKKINKVISFDISTGSLKTAKKLSEKLSIINISFVNGSLLDVPFKSETFDLIWCWGVVMITPNPYKAIKELFRILKPGGIIILAVYLKTELTFVHEIVRKFCLRYLNKGIKKKLFIKFIAIIIRALEKFVKFTESRPDNYKVEAQIDDWFFVPYKYFFSIQEMERLFTKNNISFRLLDPKTGRFESSSNFVVEGTKLK